MRGMIIGIGSRRGVARDEVSAAIESALCDAGIGITDVRIFASSRLKENEAGIKEAVRLLGREIVFLDDEAINAYDPPSPSEANRFGLVGVAEPSALALSDKKELLLVKRRYGRVTIAIAR
jgi:cobalt-precorrin 5A hydrolase